MKQRILVTFVALAGLLAAAGPASAQFPDKFTNLEVFPKDISKSDLQAAMRRFSFALGVRCDHCHVEKADKSMDFAAEDKDEKKTARLMLEMVMAVNRDYVAKLSHGDHQPLKVECVTCHHGLAEPRTLNQVLADDIREHGVTQALAHYDELRGKYYGSGAYDFGEATFNQLAESLLAQKKSSAALAVMEKHFAVNHPDSMWSYHMLAQAHEATGQTENALADYRKILELHPEDAWARKQIEALSGAKK